MSFIILDSLHHSTRKHLTEQLLQPQIQTYSMLMTMTCCHKIIEKYVKQKLSIFTRFKSNESVYISFYTLIFIAQCRVTGKVDGPFGFIKELS